MGVTGYIYDTSIMRNKLFAIWYQFKSNVLYLSNLYSGK